MTRKGDSFCLTQRGTVGEVRCTVNAVLRVSRFESYRCDLKQNKAVAFTAECNAWLMKYDMHRGQNIAISIGSYWRYRASDTWRDEATRRIKHTPDDRFASFISEAPISLDSIMDFRAFGSDFYIAEAQISTDDLITTAGEHNE